MNWINASEQTPPPDQPLLVASRDGDFWFYGLVTFDSRKNCWIGINGGFDKVNRESRGKRLTEIGWEFWKTVEPPNEVEQGGSGARPGGARLGEA